jgi:hypothetical protein
MKLLVAAVTMSLVTQLAVADEAKCACVEFPFKPEPPCNSFCFKRLTERPSPDLSKIKDPGVALSIRVLSQSPDVRSIDFSRIRTKADLEELALTKVEQRQVRIEGARMD